MPETGRHFVIAGAGISGLTLALALAQRGARVTVLERSPAVQEVGAGLQISPNARHVLDQLGLDEAVAAVSFEPKALDTYPHGAASPLLSMELGDVLRQRFGAPYAVMHRGDLAEVLYRACAAQSNIRFEFGVRGWEVRHTAEGVEAIIETSEGVGLDINAHAFIGADGVHSQTRRNVLDGTEASFDNRIAWRTLVPTSQMAGLIASDRVSVFFGTGFHLVCYPLPHRQQVNLALFMPNHNAEEASQPKPARPGSRVEAILKAAGATWTPWPLYTVETETWHKGNIGLIGDAAHAMVPFQAQGAAMGIEDAAVLAPFLLETKSGEAAFEHYARLRQDRVRRVAALSAQNGKIFHMPWPLSMARDGVMVAQGPQAHLQRLGWIYEYKAGTATH